MANDPSQYTTPQLPNPSTNLRMNITDLLSAHQSYINQDYANYVNDKNAYQRYIDMNTRAQAIASVESQKHQADSGQLTDTLQGAGAGASLGTAILPGWGTAIGGLLGAAGGFIGGTLNKNSADSQAAAAEAKINSEPLGQVMAPDITGNLPMSAQAWAAATGLANTAGSIARGMQTPSGTPPLTNANQTLNAGTPSPSGPQQFQMQMGGNPDPGPLQGSPMYSPQLNGPQPGSGPGPQTTTQMPQISQLGNQLTPQQTQIAKLSGWIH